MSYSHSRGGYAGVTVDAAYVSVRKDVNEKFYGYKVGARDILGGRVDRPRAAEPLYAALDRFYATVFPQRQGHGDEFYGADGAPPRTFAGGTGYVADGSAYGHRRASGADDLRYDEYGRPILVSAEPPAPPRAPPAQPVVRAQPGATAPRVVTAVKAKPAGAKPAGPVRAGRVVAARRSPSASGPSVVAVPPAREYGSAPPPPVVSAVRASQPAVDAAPSVDAAPPPAEPPVEPTTAPPAEPPASQAPPEPEVDPLTGLPISSTKKRVVAPKAGLFDEDEEKEV